MRSLFCLIGWLVAFFLCPVQGQDSLSTNRSWDTQQLEERVGESRFQYGQEPLPEVPEEAPGAGEDAFDWRWIFYTLLALGLGALAYLVLRRTWIGSGRVLNSDAAPRIETREQLDQQDFTSLIQQAEAEAAYRLAIRYRFLELLKGLSQAELIQWQPHKTDRQYLHELKREDLRQALQPLILAYEYAWYGEYLPAPDRYRQLARQFEAFRQRLPRRAT